MQRLQSIALLQALRSNAFPPLIPFSFLVLYFVHILVSEHAMVDKRNVHRQVIRVYRDEWKVGSAAALVRKNVVTKVVQI